MLGLELGRLATRATPRGFSCTLAPKASATPSPPPRRNAPGAAKYKNAPIPLRPHPPAAFSLRYISAKLWDLSAVFDSPS